MSSILPARKSDAFLTAMKFVLPHEEEFVRGHWGDDSREEFVRTENVSGDSGGVTRYGIDQRSHPGVNIAKLTKEQAIEIYWQEWIDHRLDLLPPKLAVAAFDVYVNGGYPIRWLQHAYNVSHQGAKLLAEDNQLGPITLAALNSANKDALLRPFIQQRNDRFAAISQNPSKAKFLSGWVQRDVDLEKFLNVYFPPSIT